MTGTQFFVIWTLCSPPLNLCRHAAAASTINNKFLGFTGVLRASKFLKAGRRSRNVFSSSTTPAEWSCCIGFYESQHGDKFASDYGTDSKGKGVLAAAAAEKRCSLPRASHAPTRRAQAQDEGVRTCNVPDHSANHEQGAVRLHGTDTLPSICLPPWGTLQNLRLLHRRSQSPDTPGDLW